MRNVLILFCLLLIGATGCSSDRETAQRRDAVDPETEDLGDTVRRPIDKAEAVQQQLDDSREARDKAIEEASDP